MRQPSRLVRMISGALTLSLIVLLRRRPRDGSTANWRSAVMLFTYMAFFSFAYLSLSAGTGALVLFGAVQLTMFIVALREGEHFSLLSWAGLTAAILGLIYLVSPGLTAPDPVSAVLMAIAGIAWGFYSLLGRGAADPLEATARNFVYSVPLVLVVSLSLFARFQQLSEWPGLGGGLRSHRLRLRLCHLVCGASRADRHAGSDRSAHCASDRGLRRSRIAPRNRLRCVC